MADWRCGQWKSPKLEELLPDLSREEQLRLQNQFRERERKLKRHKNFPPLPPECSEDKRDDSMIIPVQDALRHYNARHPGAEFDLVKPLMETRVGFKGQAWFHTNFWARSRSTNKIKRFFAEVHYKPSTSRFFFSGPHSFPVPVPVPIVEICTIIEEPLCGYKRSCAFCPSKFDILHPKGVSQVHLWKRQGPDRTTDHALRVSRA
ncbi:hypothetical protein QOZ80_2BG0194710 [Eleusine coracana subsp. coracana]|nr:hypothetical protein QOZ80_2BG0194710 [Eleusine coracana subsp. coracana]